MIVQQLVVNERLNIIVNGSHFIYLKAIPLFASYTLEIRVGEEFLFLSSLSPSARDKAAVS